MLEVPINSPQYTQPAQPAQPSQPSQNYSSETTMQTTAGDEVLSKVTVALDKDAMKIITEASAIHGESIVNLGIKLFAKTNMYKEFMLKKEFIPLDTTSDDLISLSDVAVVDTPLASATTSTATMQAPSTATANQSSGFTAW